MPMMPADEPWDIRETLTQSFAFFRGGTFFRKMAGTLK